MHGTFQLLPSAPSLLGIPVTFHLNSRDKRMEIGGSQSGTGQLDKGRMRFYLLRWVNCRIRE